MKILILNSLQKPSEPSLFSSKSRFSFVWFSVEISRVFLILQPSKDSHCVIPRKVVKDSHIPTEVAKVFDNPRELSRIYFPRQRSKILSSPTVSKDFSSSTIKDFESPATAKDFSSSAVKDFIISSYQGFIFLGKIANQLTCAYITFIYHKHIYCIIHFMQHNFVFQLTFYLFRDRINSYL